MRESIISRVTKQKFVHNSIGIRELKYFFFSHVKTDGGSEVPSTASRAPVKKMITAENLAKPLSDSKLVTLLSAGRIIATGRTVAKYREFLFIPPSNQRKQLV